MRFLRSFVKILPTILTALVLGVVVWVSAVTSSDPNEEVTYAEPIPITLLGLNPGLIITDQSSDTVSVTIKAPRSIQNQLQADPSQIRAVVNLSGLDSGEHTLTPQVSTLIGPTQIVKVSPLTIDFVLEKLTSKEFDITLRLTGSLPISYEAGKGTLEVQKVQVVGPQSQVDRVSSIVAAVDLTNTISSISRTVELRPLDSRGVLVTGVSLNPAQVNVEVPIKQLGGYRNVFVKINTTGSVARGFYLTGITANPPNITIYANDPTVAENMPSYIETAPIDLTGAGSNFEVQADLVLPDGIVVVGNQAVTVQVGVSAIQSSIRLIGIPVETINVTPGLKVALSPTTVDIYISGPLYLLETISSQNVKATLDMAQKTVGTYQMVPIVNLNNPSLRLDSILPVAIEVTLSR